MAEPLSISRGPNRGEAAFLGESSFDPIRFTESIVRQEQQNRLQQKKDSEKRLEALLSDDFKAKWDIDKIKYFDPKIKSFRDDVISLFRANDGRIPAEQRILLENKKKAIEEEVLLSNKLQESYINQVKLLDADKAGAYNQDESRRNLKTFADPTSNPETAKEVQELYGGDVFKWRADNAMKYGLVPSLDREKIIMDVTKGADMKPQIRILKDEKGQPIYRMSPSGQYSNVKEAGVTDEQISAKVDAIYNGSDTRSKKVRNDDIAVIEQNFVIDENGDVVPSVQNEMTNAVMEIADLRGKTTPDEVKKALAKAYTFYDIRRRFPVSQEFRSAGKIAQPRTSGGGGGWDSRFKPIVTELEETTTKKLFETLGLELPPSLQSDVPFEIPKGGKYINIAKIKGSTNTEGQASTTIKGEPVTVLGFRVNPSGGVTMDYVSKQQYNNLLSGKTTKMEIVRDFDLSNPKNAEVLGQISAEYAAKDAPFSTGDGFIKYLQKLAGITPAPKTKTEAKAKTATTPAPAGKRIEWKPGMPLPKK